MNTSRRIAMLSLAATLTGCALPRIRPPEPFALRLSPASLGRELALQQRMTITVHGFSQQLDVALEVDAQSVRMAVMAFGQTLARLDWDGHDLKETRARGWPPAVTGARVLSDLQLVHWPAEAIRAALPAGMTLQADEQGRELRSGGNTLVRVRYPAPGIAELENIPGQYRLRLDAWPGSA